MPLRVYTVAEKIQIVKWYFLGNSAREIVKLFIAAYADRPAPNSSTVLYTIKRFETFGCVAPCKQCYQLTEQHRQIAAEMLYKLFSVFLERMGSTNYCEIEQIRPMSNQHCHICNCSPSSFPLVIFCIKTLMYSCAVRSCTSYAQRHKNNSTGITFHSFPKDLKRRNIWINFVDRGEWVPSTKSKLCSKHFMEEYINRTSLSCVRLRHNAIPTIGGPQNLQSTLPVKQEQDNPFFEEQEIGAVEENFLSNTIKEENEQICNGIKTEFVSIKEENDEDLELDYSQNCRNITV